MLKRHLITKTIAIAALALALAPAGAAAAPGDGLVTGPMVITSSTLSADSGANVAVFEGSVVATTDDISLHSDRMTVYYDEGGAIEKIEVEGSVRLLKEDRVLSAGQATYIAKEQKIIFTGEPMAVEGDNVITGSKITYMIDEDKTIVQDSKVFLKQVNGQ